MKQVQSHAIRCDSRGVYKVPVTRFKDLYGRTVAEIVGNELSIERRVWNAKNIEILAEIVAAFQKEVSE